MQDISKEIDFSINYSGNYIIFGCSNKYDESIAFTEENIPISTKEEKELHGFGSLILKEISEKYNGYVKYSTDDNIFKVKVFLLNTVK